MNDTYSKEPAGQTNLNHKGQESSGLSDSPIEREAPHLDASLESPMRLDDWADMAEANQKNFDRRNRQRKKQPRISSRIQVQRLLNAIVYRIHGSRFYQIGFALITALSLGLIWFSLSERAPLASQAYEDISEIGRLETELLAIQQLWSDERMNEINEGIKSADKRRIFSDFQGLAIWLNDKGNYANQLDLSFEYHLEEGTRAQIDNTLEIPIAITLKPKDQDANSAYFQLMEFTRRMLSTPFFVNIQETRVESSGEGATELQTKISVWVHEQVHTDG